MLENFHMVLTLAQLVSMAYLLIERWSSQMIDCKGLSGSKEQKFELAQFTKISEQLVQVLFLLNKLILLKCTDINDLNCNNNIQH